jgi:uncharacterized membrane protein (UPF0127 family)
MLAARFEELPRRRVCGHLVPVATNARSRLLGLARLSADQAGPGLLIPGCAGVHTFGMRFDLDLVFLDAEERSLAIVRRLPPRRVTWHRRAAAVLELPARPGGEFAFARDLGSHVAAETGDRQRRRL